jgi:hypothetical protein
MNKLTLLPGRYMTVTSDCGDEHSKLEVSIWAAPPSWSMEQMEDAVALELPHEGEDDGNSFATEGRIVHTYQAPNEPEPRQLVVVCREYYFKG